MKVYLFYESRHAAVKNNKAELVSYMYIILSKRRGRKTVSINSGDERYFHFLLYTYAI